MSGPSPESPAKGVVSDLPVRFRSYPQTSVRPQDLPEVPHTYPTSPRAGSSFEPVPRVLLHGGERGPPVCRLNYLSLFLPCPYFHCLCLSLSGSSPSLLPTLPRHASRVPPVSLSLRRTTLWTTCTQDHLEGPRRNRTVPDHTHYPLPSPTVNWLLRLEVDVNDTGGGPPKRRRPRPRQWED